MEKEQNKDFYWPLAPSYPIKTTELIHFFLESAGEYKKIDTKQRAFLLLYSELLKNGENLTGPVFSFQKEYSSFPISPRWFPIIDYLKNSGLISELFLDTNYHDGRKIFKYHFICHESLFNDLTDGIALPSFRIFTHGDSLDPEEAISKVIGELLERVPLLLYREKDFLRASLKELQEKNRFFLPLNFLAGFSQKQKNKNVNFDFNEESNFLWAQGKSLFTSKSCLIPGQLIFWNYATNHLGWKEPIIRESNTNGAGGHFSLQKAILSGLYELVQRDGFLIYWLNKKAPPKINLKTIEYEPLASFLKVFDQLGLEVNFFDTTSDLKIPSCICTIFDHSGVGPKISMGGGCEMDWDKMLFRSLIEAATVRHWQRKYKESDTTGDLFLKQDYKPFWDFIGQKERLKLWANKEMFKEFDFFLKGEEKSLKELKKNFKSFSSVQDEINFIIEKFRTLGNEYEIFYYQAKHWALQDLGYFSVKVIVPSLINLYLREPFAPLGARRLKEVPEKLGFRAATEWNPLPHPFP